MSNNKLPQRDVEIQQDHFTRSNEVGTTFSLNRGEQKIPAVYTTCSS